MSPFPRIFLFALTFSAATFPALAQNKPATAPATAPASFVLGPGDVISVTVIGVPKLSSDALTLSPTGRVTLPLIGALTIKDKTLEAARNAIENAYKSQLRKPRVTITLVRAVARRATVLGAVARPGAVNLQPGWRVSEVLAAAGGLNKLVPDAVTATLKRPDAPAIALDIATIYRAPADKANALVLNGDVINVVPIPLVNITINGDVFAPGAQSFRSSPKLLEALARAGQIKLAPADTNISLLRDGKILALDVAAAMKAPQSDDNLVLRDGDLLSVQGVRLNISVVSDEGLVKNSGNYQLDGRGSFSRALEAAGGATAPARRIAATVRRGNLVIPVDVARAFYDRDADIALQNNDIIALKTVAALRVRSMGEVQSPGEYNFGAGSVILDALREAGGLNLAPAQTRIAVLRMLPDGRQISLQVDAARLLRADLSQNLELKDGDIITVRALGAPSVVITGEVEKPGIYPLAPDDGLIAALANAGFGGEVADLKRVIIDRDGEVGRVVDFSGAAPDVKLQDGDRVRVPKNPVQILVMDAVTNPGIYAIAEGTTLNLSDAITRAGGALPGARIGEIVLLRRAPVTPQAPEGYTLTRVKYDDNSALRPGDVIVVPPGGQEPSKVAQGVVAARAFDNLRGFEF